MNSKKFLKIFLLVVLLFAFVRAEDKDDESKDVEVADETKEVEEADVGEKKEFKEENNEEEEEEAKEEPKQEEKKETEPEPKKEQEKTKQEEKPKTSNASSKPTQAPAPAPAQQQPQPQKQQTKPTTSSNANTNSSNTSSNSNANAKSETKTNNTQKVSNPNVPKTSNESADNANKAAPAADNAASPVVNAATPAAGVAGAANATNAPVTNAVVPQVNNVPSSQSISTTSNVSADNNVDKEEGGNGVVTTTVISLVAVGAVVGVATVGVNAYKKKTNGDNTRGADLADIEAQPINTDFGNNMAPEDYNPYNIMNDAPAEPYITNNPYEYKPSYTEEAMDTTPFQKTEAAQDNFMSRESIFSNSGNIPQIGNDVFNFGENAQLPYVQELPVENAYIEEPVTNEIQVENYEMPNSQMPTLVPVQPEIVVTQPEEEPAQEGYKQIVPNVAQMEIIDTPDFNNMTTSMIEDHINNMDLEQLANTETKPTETTDDNGYKQIVPDIQEAVIENFDIEDDEEEDQDISVVDNITDTYRAALRATYCSTTDDNRFSYRTVDSDHSLLHTMREDGEW